MSDKLNDSSKKLRQALGTFATGVTVVTTVDGDGKPRGFTANSFTSVSLDPPLILVCLSKESASCPAFSESRHFCVNILAETQQEISAIFATPGLDRFAQVDWQKGGQGPPVLADVISWFECETHRVVDGGDHVILLGRVVDHDFNSRSPLVYCGGAYVEFGLLQRAMEAASSGVSTRISAIVNCDGSIPFDRDAKTGKLSLPTAGQVGNTEEPRSLIGKLFADGINVEMPFVCAVYEDMYSKTHHVVYRSVAENVDASLVENFEMIPLDEVPWDSLVDKPLRMLLERYIEESERDTFGVYVGNTEKGEVRAVTARH